MTDVNYYIKKCKDKQGAMAELVSIAILAEMQKNQALALVIPPGLETLAASQSLQTFSQKDCKIQIIIPRFNSEAIRPIGNHARLDLSRADAFFKNELFFRRLVRLAVISAFIDEGDFQLENIFCSQTGELFRADFDCALQTAQQNSCCKQGLPFVASRDASITLLEGFDKAVNEPLNFLKNIKKIVIECLLLYGDTDESKGKFFSQSIEQYQQELLTEIRHTINAIGQLNYETIQEVIDKVDPKDDRAFIAFKTQVKKTIEDNLSLARSFAQSKKQAAQLPAETVCLLSLEELNTSNAILICSFNGRGDRCFYYIHEKELDALKSLECCPQARDGYKEFYCLNLKNSQIPHFIDKKPNELVNDEELGELFNAWFHEKATLHEFGQQRPPVRVVNAIPITGALPQVHANNSAVAHSTLNYPVSYLQMINYDTDGNFNYLATVKAVLSDYCKSNFFLGSAIGLFLTLHWGRHHITEVKNALEMLQADAVDEEVITTCLGELKRLDKNSNGSLNRRLEFLEEVKINREIILQQTNNRRYRI